jgi:predicted nuclease of predicted toxin-antitoxin system
VKLLLDQNLSPRLAERLRDLFPESAHTRHLGLESASDDTLWVRARQDRFAIVRKDGDFGELSVVRGFPPKVVWLQLGNCSTSQVEAALRRHREALELFDADSTAGIFVIR